MKLRLIAMMLLFSSSITAQNVEYKLYQIKSDKLWKKVRESESLDVLSAEEKKNYVVPLKDAVDVMKEDRKEYDAEVDSKFYLECYDKNNQRITLSEAEFGGISIEKFGYNLIDFRGDRRSFAFSFKDLGDKPEKNEKILIAIKKGGVSAKVFGVFYNNGFEWYGWGGFWVPTNMYSFNGRSTVNGIEVGIYPIAGAWGGKIRFGSDWKFIGTSITVNPGYSTSSTNNAVLVNSISIGPVIDLGGIIYVGYHKGIDLTSNKSKSLEDRIIVGFSLKLVSIFTQGNPN